MTAYPELVGVLDRIASALTRAGVTWFVTGSLAGSVHGEFRATNDVDIVADILPDQLDAVLKPLAREFVFDTDEARAAITAGRGFNMIHQETLLKVDIFPCATEFERDSARRAEPVQLPGAREPLPVASREGILLAKLRWFRLGGEVSSVQRRDIERLVELNRGEFDLPYLRRWADALGVGDLLARFLPDVGG